MAGWRPPDTTPLNEIREARAALDLGWKYIEAAYGPLGLVRLSDLSGGNALALRLLHDALGYAPDRVHKRVASGAVTAAIRGLDGSPPARDATLAAEVAPQVPVPQADAGGKKAEDLTEDDSAPPRPAVIITPPPRRASGTEVRRLTDAGIERAKEFLANMRENPSARPEPPRELLFGDRFSRLFMENVRVERRPFRTRREAAEYFAPRFSSIRHLISDHAGVWSWLGMYYFADTVQVEGDIVRLSPVDETFIVQPDDRRSYLLRYRHYLWSAWRLHETHGEGVAFLLDQELTSFGDIPERALGSIRLFNSKGIIQLILRLYTQGKRQKRGFGQRPGGLRHLVRVLDQLERTYDVYGMSPDALIKVLPEEFQRWDGQSAPHALNGATSPEPTVSVAADPVDEAAISAPSGRGEPVEPRPMPAVNTAAPPEPVPRTAEPFAAYPDRAEPVRGEPVAPVRGELVEPQAGVRPFGGLRAGSSTSSGRTEAPPDPPSVRQTLLDIRAQVEQQGQVTWADPREHLEVASEAWKAYLAVCGVPERRLFRTAFLYRLDEVLAALD